MKTWMQIPVKDRIELLRMYRENGTSYKDAIKDFEKSYQKLSGGGFITAKISDEEEISIPVPIIETSQPTYTPKPTQDSLVKEKIATARNPFMENTRSVIPRDEYVTISGRDVDRKKAVLENNRNRFSEDITISRLERAEESENIGDYIPPTRRSINLSDITTLQKNLVESGFDVGKYGIDGKMGKDTIIALQKFLNAGGYDIGQNEYTSMGIDGVLGVKTRAAIDQFNNDISNPTKSTSYYQNQSGYIGPCDTDQCAAYVNTALDRFYGISPEEQLAAGITGNAWQRESNILNAGGELLYKADISNNTPTKITDNLDRIAPGDNLQFYTGGRSNYQEQAGQFNPTHTGIVDSTIQHDSDGKAYVYLLHNIHRRVKDGWEGRIFRDKFYLKDAKIEGRNYKLVSAVRPNVEGAEIITKTPDPTLGIDTSNIDNPIAINAASKLNDIELRRKVMQLYNIDNEEYFSLASSVLGIMEQESKFGEVDKLPVIGGRGELKLKETLAKTVRTLGNVLPEEQAKKISSRVGRDVTGEASRGYAQIKFDTNFDNIRNLVRTDFGIKKQDLNISRDDGSNSATAALLILARNYNNLKSKFNEEDALYLAIQQHSRYNLNRKIGNTGKTSIEFMQERDLDYTNKILQYADNYSVKNTEGRPFSTFLTGLNLDERTIRNQSRLFIRD